MRRYFLDRVRVGERGYQPGDRTYDSMPDALLAAYCHLFRLYGLRPCDPGDALHHADGETLIVALSGASIQSHLYAVDSDPLAALAVYIGAVDLEDE
jgi:hypothetical protein